MSHKKQTSRRQFLKQTGAVATVFSIFSRRSFGEGKRPPNILFFFPDQHRPDWSSLNKGLPVRTPNFAQLAGNGVHFTQCVTPSPLCAPARACLALGREYDHAGVASNKNNLPERAVTLYARLRDAGYRVGGVGKFDLRKGASDWGVDGRHRVDGRVYFDEWGFTDGLDSEGKGGTLIRIVNRDDPPNAHGESPYLRMLTDRKDGSLQRYLEWNRKTKEYPVAWAHTEPMDIADEAYNDNWVGRNGLEVLQNFPTDKPWFLQANFPGPHPPEDITPGMAAWYRDAAFPGPHDNDQLAPEKHTEIRRNYSAMVDNIDQWLGRYLKEVARRGELQNTIIVWSSDHGEMLGDHNRWGKSVPYQSALGIPLLVSGPGIRKGAVHDGPATSLDLTATFLDFAGVPDLPNMDSRSLRPVLEGKAEKGREHVTSGLGSWRTVFDGRYKLTRGFDPAKSKEEGGDAAAVADGEKPLLLFDLKNDPNEDHNLAGENAEQVTRLSKLLPVPVA